MRAWREVPGKCRIGRQILILKNTRQTRIQNRQDSMADQEQDSMQWAWLPNATMPLELSASECHNATGTFATGTLPRRGGLSYKHFDHDGSVVRLQYDPRPYPLPPATDKTNGKRERKREPGEE